jgi:hypothetical protein
MGRYRDTERERERDGSRIGLGVVVAALLLCVVGWEGVMKGMERNNNKVATGEQFLEIAQVFGIWGLSPSLIQYLLHLPLLLPPSTLSLSTPAATI